MPAPATTSLGPRAGGAVDPGGALEVDAQPANPPLSGQRLLLGICVWVAATAPLCLFLGALGLAPVVGLAGVLCLPWTRLSRRDWPGLLSLAALALWAAITVAWSPAPNLRLPRDARALGVFTVAHLPLLLVLCAAFVTAFRRLDRAAAEKALAWIGLGLMAAPPLLIEEGLNQAWLYRAVHALIHKPIRQDWVVAHLAEGGYVIAVVGWPLGVAFAKRGRVGALLAAGLALFVPTSMVVLRGVAPTVALAIGLLVFILSHQGGPRAIKALGIGVAIYILATPLGMLAMRGLDLYGRFKPAAPPSWSDRLRIWSFVAEQFSRAPLRGAGLDASRSFPGVVPLHPHNAPLQLWYELGAPGAVLATCFWLWLWRRMAECAERSRLLGATAAAAAASYLAIGSVSFGIWQDWWICVGALAMMLCVMLGRVLLAEHAVAPSAPITPTATFARACDR